MILAIRDYEIEKIGFLTLKTHEEKMLVLLDLKHIQIWKILIKKRMKDEDIDVEFAKQKVKDEIETETSSFNH